MDVFTLTVTLIFLVVMFYGYVLFFLILGHSRSWRSFVYPHFWLHLFPSSWRKRFGLEDRRIPYRALAAFFIGVCLLAAYISFVVILYRHPSKEGSDVLLYLTVAASLAFLFSAAILFNIADKLPDQRKEAAEVEEKKE